MKRIIKLIFILLLIASLGLNVLLLHERENTNKKECEIDDINSNKKNIKVTKDTFAKLFKEYQKEAKFSEPDKMALFDVVKVTEVGFFKNNNKRLFYVEEKYSCIEGTDCLKTIGKVTTDDTYVNTTTYVVAAEIIDKDTIVFEILDYGIETNENFVKIDNKILK